MPCEFDRGGWICGRGSAHSDPDPPCYVCGQPADRLCDGDVGDGRTCDRPICSGCSVQTPPVVQLPSDPIVQHEVRRILASRRRWGPTADASPLLEAIEADERDFCPEHSAQAPQEERET